MLSEDMGSLFVDAFDRERRPALIAFLAALMSSGSSGRKP
jgi:hypothetical protein